MISNERQNMNVHTGRTGTGDRLRTSRIVRAARQNLVATSALLALLLVALLTIFAPIVSPFSYSEQSLLTRLEEPGNPHFLGTDGLGRDVLSRLLWGGRISLAVGLGAAFLTVVVGTLVGGIAGFMGGLVDQIAMRLTDVFMSIPPVLMILLVVTIFGGGLWLTVLTIGLVMWPGTARLIRGEFMKIRNLEYVDAARVVGVNPARIMLRHMLPNAVAPLVVQGSLLIAESILIESGLSFLGLGVQPPTPSWGNMLFDGRRFMDDAWWISTWPGVAIFITVLGLNLSGDFLRDLLDPRMRTS